MRRAAKLARLKRRKSDLAQSTNSRQPFAFRADALSSDRETEIGGAAPEGGMPLFRYFLAVGALLTLGLLALSAYLEPASRDAAARVSVTPTTASLAHIAPRQPNSK